MAFPGIKILIGNGQYFDNYHPSLANLLFYLRNLISQMFRVLYYFSFNTFDPQKLSRWNSSNYIRAK